MSGRKSMDERNVKRILSWRRILGVLFFPVWLLFLPFVKAAQALDRNFVSYLTGRVVRDENRIYCIKFIWYSDSIYLHPMIWGSLILYVLAASGVASGWLLLFWFVGLALCYVTIMYNLDVIRTAILGTAVVALLGLAYFSTIELSWNPLTAIAHHVSSFGAEVSPGFFIASAYLFALLIAFEVIWAWLFHRVEIDESYVYEHRFLTGTTREPIFAQGLKRETKDLLEMLVLGAADIQHRTKKGFKRFQNVPFASLWLGRAIDSLLDYRRKGQIALEKKQRDESGQARIQDAIHEEAQDWDDDADDDVDDGMDDGAPPEIDEMAETYIS